MSLPRMSLDALSARLQTDRRTLCAIVEGFNDRRVLTSWSESEKLPVNFYCADEIEVEIEEIFRVYGGNKGRVITILSTAPVEHFADQNAIGVIDRDLDTILTREVNAKGVYYTQYSCLFSQLLSADRIKKFIGDVFHKVVPEQFVDEVCSTSERMFRLRAEKQRLRPEASLPEFSGYVRRVSAGGFNWDGYLNACLPRFGGSTTKEQLLLAVHQVGTDDVRSVMHLHSTVEIIWQLGRKERVFDNTVSLEEVYRHLRSFYLRLCGECETAALVRRKICELN